MMNIEKNSTGNAMARPMPFSPIAALRTFARNKTHIVIATAIGTALAAGVAMLIPPTYQATATLLPPQQPQSSAGALLSQLSNATGVMSGAAAMKSPTDLYVGVLKSRTIADELVRKFRLQAAYEITSVELARNKLKTNTNIGAGKDGLITIAVEDGDRQRAADVANGYVSALTRLTKVLALTEASQRRLFFQKELEVSQTNLANAELALKRGLDTKGVISVDADSRTVLETIARLRARISAKEVEINAMRSFVTEQNNEFKRAQAELVSLRQELSTLEYGRSSAVGTTGDSAKQSGLENIRLLRDVKYHQMLYELLAKQFEAARLEEARDAALIQVLDSAVPPEKKVKPKRAMIVLAGALVSFALSFAFFFWVERRRQMMAPEADRSVRSVVRYWANSIA